jgi:hypothetical protein
MFSKIGLTPSPQRFTTREELALADVQSLASCIIVRYINIIRARGRKPIPQSLLILSGLHGSQRHCRDFTGAVAMSRGKVSKRACGKRSVAMSFVALQAITPFSMLDCQD